MTKAPRNAGYIAADVPNEIAQRFYDLCDKRGVQPSKMLETMVRSFDRGSTVYGLEMRIDFGKYSGMLIDDIIRTDPRYMRWLVNTSEWFKLTTQAQQLLEYM